MGRLRHVFSAPTVKYPLLLLVALGGLCFWYYTASINRSRTALNHRAFHELSMFASQFADQMSQYRWEIRYAPKSDPDRTLDPDVTEGSCDKDEIAGASALTITPINAVGVENLLLSPTSSSSSRSAVCYTIRIDKALASSVEAFEWDLFQDIFLADTTGEVLYQTGRSHASITDLRVFYRALENSSGKNGAAGKSQSASLQPAADDSSPHDNELDVALGASRVIDVELGGERYKLFTFPVRVLSQPQKPANFPANAAFPSKANFVVGGIVPERSFRNAETEPLATKVVIVSFILALILLGSYSVLKYSFMSRTDVLARETGLLCLLQMITTATLLGGFFLYIFQDQTPIDNDLRSLSSYLESRMVGEVSQALDQLEQMENEKSFPEYLPPYRHEEQTCKPGEEPLSNNVDRNRSNKYLSSRETYPFFNHAFWTDDKGYQLFKWSRDNTRPMNIAGFCTHPSFQAVFEHKQKLWAIQQPPTSKDASPQQFFIDAGFSATAGKYLAFIGRRFQTPVENNRTRHSTAYVFAAIATPLVSLSDAVLPPGYGFAVIDRDGTVYFHSVSTRQGRENFLGASDEDRQLLGLAHLRQAGFVDLSYLGVPHHVFVKPLNSLVNCPWNLVVFRDLSDWNADRVKTAIIFAELLATYIGFLLFTMSLVALCRFVLRDNSKVPAWAWPQNDYRSTYIHIVLVLILVFFGSMPVILSGSPTQIVIVGFLLSPVALVMVCLKLRSRSEELLAWKESPHAATRSFDSKTWIVVLAAATALFAFIWLIVSVVKGEPRLMAGCTLVTSLAFLLLLIKGPQPREFRPETTFKFSTPAVYAIAGQILLLLVGFRPAFAFYQAAIRFQGEVTIRREQLQLAEQIRQQTSRISAEYGESRVLDAMHNWEPQDEWSNGHSITRRNRPPADSDDPEYRLDPLLSFFAFDMFTYQGGTTDRLVRLGIHPDATWKWIRCNGSRGPMLVMRHVGENGACDPKDTLAPGIFLDDDNRVYQIVSLLPGWKDFTTFHDFRGWNWIKFIVYFVFALILPVFIVTIVVNRLFVWKICFVRTWMQFQSLDKLPAKRTIILGLPHSGKTKRFKDFQTEYVDLIDVAKDLRYSQPANDATIVLDHFEYCCSTYVRNRRVLDYMEQLVREHNGNIVVLSTIDPLYFLQYKQSSAEELQADAEFAAIDLERWRTTLADFQIVLLDDQASSTARGENYYHLLWSTCTGEERLALNQLARYGWPNHRQKRALLHLWERELLKKDPTLVIDDSQFNAENLSFECYIRDCITDKDRGLWIPGDQLSQWDVLRVVFVVLAAIAVVIGVLVFGNETVAYVTTGVGAVTAGTKMFAGIKGRGSPGEGLKV